MINIMMSMTIAIQKKEEEEEEKKRITSTIYRHKQRRIEY